MEVRVYKTGEEKKIDIRDSSINQVISSTQYKEAFAAIEARNKLFLSIEGERIIENADFSIFKDFSGNNLSTTPSGTADAINAILASNREVDSYIVGDDLSQKSEDTQFVHNDSITNGGAVVLSDNGAKIGVEGNHMDFDSTGSYGDAEINVKTSGANSARAVHIYGTALSQNPQIDFEGDVDFQQSISGVGVTDLDDTPGSLGTSGQVLAVNSGATALEWVSNSGSGGSSTFLALTDTPSGFGTSGQVVAVNSGATALEFVDQSGSSQTLDGQKIEYITRSTAYANGSYEGKVMKFGTATLQSLKLYQYTSSGWSPTDANQTGKAEGLLGLALGTSESSDGLLLDGLISSTAFTGFSAGDKLYVSETESAITNTAPTATGSIVRIVGYALGSGYVHFNPSDNFIELA